LDAACQLDAALLLSLAIAAESLPEPANSSLGLNPAGRLSSSVSLQDLRYTKPKFLNNTGDKRAPQWRILAVGDPAIKNAAGSKYMTGGVVSNWAR
jgi:hypothetical protein